MLRQLSGLFRKQYGQAIVEFVIVLPLLLLVFSAIIDMGRVYHHFLLAEEAVRDGVRRAAAGNIDGIQNVVHTYDKNFAVTVNPNPPVSGRPVTVTVTGTVTIITPIIRKVFSPNPYPVKAIAMMQAE